MEKFYLYLATYIPFFVILIIFFLIFKENKKKRLYYFLSFFTGAVALFIRKLFPLFLKIQRPNQLSFDSFPSGHASFLFAISFFIFFYDKKIGSLLILLSIINGVSRVLSKFHWGIDILGGAVLGFLVSYIFFIFLNKK